MSTTLLSRTSGKLQRQPIEIAASCQRKGHRIFVTNQVTKRRCLVACCSDICCFPRTFLRDERPCTSFELSVANHSTIETYGSLRLNINFQNLCRDVPWNFVIADVTEPIIRSGFLAYYNILPDCRYDRIIDSTTGLTPSGQRATTQQPNVDIHYISGKENVVTDALSRIAAVELPTVTTDALAEAQKTNTEFQQLLEKGSSFQLQKVTIPGSTEAVYCDISTGRRRPYVSSLHRQSLFNQLHGLSHPDIQASTRFVTDRYAWASVQRDCRAWARTCIQCQRAKITRHVTSPLGEFPLPTERFQHVCIDIIGSLTPASPYRYCLTAINRYTRWLEVWPLEKITAEDVASAFFSGLVSRFDTPRHVTFNQGRQFETQLFRLLGLSTRFERSRTTSYHPCANEMIEWFHRQFKAAIMCYPHSTWLEALPAVALGVRATFKADIQASPAEFIHGEPLCLPGELLSTPTSDVTISDPAGFATRLRRTMSVLRPSPAAHHIKPTPFVFKDLATCSHAFLYDDTVRAPFQPPYSGSYKVIHRDDKTFTLQISATDVRVSVDHFKPSYIISH
nr:uncharacterized protein LOC119175047 [Rhipicephalus microplus]